MANTFQLYPPLSADSNQALTGDVTTIGNVATVVGFDGILLGVGATSPADQDVWTYDAASGTWIPQAIPTPPATDNNQSILVDGLPISDDFFVTVDYIDGYPPFVMSVATFKWADALPGIVVNATGTWVLET